MNEKNRYTIILWMGIMLILLVLTGFGFFFIGKLSSKTITLENAVTGHFTTIMSNTTTLKEDVSNLKYETSALKKEVANLRSNVTNDMSIIRDDMSGLRNDVNNISVEILQEMRKLLQK